MSERKPLQLGKGLGNAATLGYRGLGCGRKPTLTVSREQRRCTLLHPRPLRRFIVRAGREKMPLLERVMW